MKINNLRTNSLYNPIGYDFSYITLSWKVTEAASPYSEAVRLILSENDNMENPIYDTGVLNNYRECTYALQIVLKPRTRYFWQVWVKDTLGKEAISKPAFFETGKCQEAWRGKWIGTQNEDRRMPILFKKFAIDSEKEVDKARLYIYGAGLYEAYLNGNKIGREYLQPGYHSYDLLMEYQTYDLSNYVWKGEQCLSVILGEGWYKGRFGFDGDYRNLYGEYKKCIAELIITYTDGTEKWIVTDTSWQAKQSNILQNNIYDGEVIDDTLPEKGSIVREFSDDIELLTERTNPPICKTECFEAVSVMNHPDGYLLLDFGESITGWVEWTGKLDEGQKVKLSFGEILQNGGFYNENYRTAKSEFVYKSDGKKNSVRPHFTFFGFRYVKAEGLKAGQELHFLAYRLMSDIETTGSIITSNEKVNQLIDNTLRSQKCNFLDIPTDCPQRDERMGWTGDVAIFAKTACFHMDCSTFFRHYAKSLYKEQLLLNGSIPFFAPRPKVPVDGETNPFYLTGGACGWGDVATILPWSLYEYYGDIQLLKEQYPMMCGWVDYLSRRVAENPVPYLWQNDRQLGDWLALDNGNIHNPIGKTDVHFLASIYYYYSVSLCAKAAEALKDMREKEFLELTESIKQAFILFYFNDEHLLTIEETQTACALLLAMELYPKESGVYLKEKLLSLLTENGAKLNTGFLGTPVLCPALSESGLNSMAYDLLLNEKYPGWLYEVNMGATTVWERWNSVNADGSISGTGMNSLNHYAYGSIAEWMYRYMCGFHPSMGEDIKMTIRPMPDSRIKTVTGIFESVYGTYACSWSYKEGVHISYRIEVPFNANAKVVFPNGVTRLLECGIHYFNEAGVINQKV